jgi:hypothetical protein
MHRDVLNPDRKFLGGYPTCLTGQVADARVGQVLLVSVMITYLTAHLHGLDLSTYNTQYLELRSKMVKLALLGSKPAMDHLQEGNN